MYKLIIADYDGTLADRDHVIPEETIQAIKKWIESGHLFTIASGRQYLMIKSDVEMLGLTTPLVVRGGAEVVNAKTGEVIHSEKIPSEIVSRILDILSLHTDKIAVEKDNSIYSTFPFAGNFPEVKRYQLDEFILSDVPKIMAKGEGPEKTRELEEAMQEIMKEFPMLHMVRSYTPLGSGWDITSLRGTKHLATLEVMNSLDIPSEEVVGVGDGYNDFPLLEACGLKVAMGNAPQELKDIADIVVPPIDENGVAVLIERLLSEEHEKG